MMWPLNSMVKGNVFYFRLEGIDSIFFPTNLMETLKIKFDKTKDLQTVGLVLCGPAVIVMPYNWEILFSWD